MKREKLNELNELIKLNELIEQESGEEIKRLVNENKDPQQEHKRIAIGISLLKRLSSLSLLGDKDVLELRLIGRLAIIHSQKEIVKSLYLTEVNLLGYDDPKCWAFFMAARYGKIEVVKYLVEFFEKDKNNFNINKLINSKGETALHRVCRYSIGIYRELEKIEETGYSFDDYWRLKGFSEVMEYLIDHGINTKIENKVGSTALSMLMKNKNLRGVKSFFKKVKVDQEINEALLVAIDSWRHEVILAMSIYYIPYIPYVAYIVDRDISLKILFYFLWKKGIDANTKIGGGRTFYEIILNQRSPFKERGILMSLDCEYRSHPEFLRAEQELLFFSNELLPLPPKDNPNPDAWKASFFRCITNNKIDRKPRETVNKILGNG